MVSKRQKIARKRLKEAHPELFPKPDPTSPKDPNKKKKNRKKKNDGKFKRKKSETTGPKTLNKSNNPRKHPLRIPGMKPGESCFICKAKDHIAKHCPQKEQWEKNKTCLLCRKRGHSLKNCPKKSDESTDKKLCYNCGETGHTLANCTQPLQDGGTKFASCFICKERGHLSKNCPKNTHGVYPKGGCCKICGGITHLAKDCPEKGNKRSQAAGIAALDYEEKPRGQVIKFTSGDNLEDDFMGDERHKQNRDKSSLTESNNSHIKSKKRQGPKVINFVG